MTPHKLFSFIDVLEKDELYRLKRYIQSDYFNTNERFKKLFEAIWAARTGLETYMDINEEQVYLQVFPDTKPERIMNDYSGILKLVRGFIAQEEYNNDKHTQTRYLIKGMESRKAHHRFNLLIDKEARHYERPASSKRLEYQENYLHDLLIAEQRYKYHTVHANRKKSTNQLLQEFIDSIDRFHALIKIRFAGVMKRRTILMPYNFKCRDIKIVEETLRDTNLADFPLLHLYYEMYMLWEKETPEQFDICKNILFTYQKRFVEYEQKQLYQVLINFCRFQTPLQHPHLWNVRQLALYEQFFEAGFCYTGKDQRKKQISLHHFKNYMQLLVELGHFDRFKKLQRKYSSQVYFKNEAQERFVMQYNSTALYFSQYLYYSKHKRKIGQEFAYETAVRQIQEMEEKIAWGDQEYPDVFYRVSYEVLLLKIYFDTEGFLKKRSAFYKYVNSKKHISPFFLQPYLNFARVLLQLYTLKNKKQQEQQSSKGKLFQKITRMKIIEREWLVDKIEALE